MHLYFLLHNRTCIDLFLPGKQLSHMKSTKCDVVCLWPCSNSSWESSFWRFLLFMWHKSAVCLNHYRHYKSLNDYDLDQRPVDIMFRPSPATPESDQRTKSNKESKLTRVTGIWREALVQSKHKLKSKFEIGQELNIFFPQSVYLRVELGSFDDMMDLFRLEVLVSSEEWESVCCHLQGVVDGRLRWVDDEVPQREAEPLGGSTQVERLRARPGERLLLRPGRSGGRHLTRVVPILLLGLNGGRNKRCYYKVSRTHTVLLTQI